MNRAIEDLEKFISEKLDELEEDKTITKSDKIDVIDVYYNTYKFLKDYKQNVKTLEIERIKNKYKGVERDD